MSLDYQTTHTSLSPIRCRFALGFVNDKKRCTWLAATSDKVYQLLAHGRWFSPGTLASSTTKIGRHDIAEILLKVALNTKNQSINHKINNHQLKFQFKYGKSALQYSQRHTFMFLSYIAGISQLFSVSPTKNTCLFTVTRPTLFSAATLVHFYR
jgi:hypothetical protein